MTKLTIEIPDELMSRLENQGYAVQDIVVKALERYVEAKPSNITQTRTWKMCGTLEVSEPDPKYIVGRDKQGQVITNYAEKVDDVVYRRE